jgi:catechol 2,3-dioxygenase-like lactoylglutathione lyase family enzyme
MQESSPLSAGIAYVSIGVQDMRAVAELWVDVLGLEVAAVAAGPDPELGRLWNLPGEVITAQMVLRTPGADGGYLHFVEFANPGAAVREGAATTDRGAKNIDVNCVGMPELVARLRAAGYEPRSEIAEYEVDAVRVREVQLAVHDGLNLVLIEVLTAGFEVALTAAGTAGLTSFVVIVDDTVGEATFYRQLFGMTDIMHHRIAGPEIESAAGLPPGTVLDMRLLGRPESLFGRMELIAYEGISGANRFVRAVPPATGILRCGFRISSLGVFAEQAAAHGFAIRQQVQVHTLFGHASIACCRSPAGLELELCEYSSGQSLFDA